MLLPFGAINDCVSVPKCGLSPVEDLLLDDESSGLLDGWERDHGTTDDDLIGGLIFYAKSQLVEFSERLRRFKRHIYSYDHDTSNAPRILKSDPRLF
ncbi:hypothetical protein IW261DRAFT_1564672 [Armillaria novae-zelandiae]|uniref:Uncharacterized protein n=1 Tax=Armillaria novae-zelandiae TaxID=153914 RepID=A0AA39UAI7_9AGAR|nr:hypothetical protein IW261DRAFT_1564672 [Armillaria novae-zelandiae]